MANPRFDARRPTNAQSRMPAEARVALPCFGIHRRFVRRMVCLGLAIGWSFFTGLGTVAAQTNPIVDAARLRQERIKSLDITFRISETVSKGGMKTVFGSETKGKSYPDKDTIIESENRLVISGARFRYENNHPGWHGQTGVLLQSNYVVVSNDNEAKSYYPEGVGNQGGPAGVVYSDEPPSEFKLFLLVPWTLGFRGLDGRFAARLMSDGQPGKALLAIDRSKCMQFVWASQAGSTTYWADPSIDHLPRRIQYERGFVLRDQIDIQYRRDLQNNEWLPDSWTHTQFDKDGRVLVSSKMKTVQTSVN